MKKIVVDSSTIISCATNCLTWVFDGFKERGVSFILPKSVKHEVIDDGLASQKYKYEAIRVLRHIVRGTFEVSGEDVSRAASQILNYANSSFLIRNNPLKILQEADAEVAALATKIGADAIATDERTLRMLIENPDALKDILQEKFHGKVEVNTNSIKELKKLLSGINVLRSVDLLAIAFLNGTLNETISYCKSLQNCRREIIQGILFSLKFSGCAISFEEVMDYVNILMGGKT